MDREARRISEEKAAIKIQVTDKSQFLHVFTFQAHIRKFLASRRVERIRARQRALRQIKERHAATVIQRFYRSYRNQKFEKAAIVLQSNIRMFLALRRYKRYKLNAEKQLNAEVTHILLLVSQSITEKRFRKRWKSISHKSWSVFKTPSKKNSLMRSWMLYVITLFPKPRKPPRLQTGQGRWMKNPNSNTMITPQVILNWEISQAFLAVTIQRSWRGYKCRFVFNFFWPNKFIRRRHSDVLEKLTKTRLSIKNAPNILENPKEHRSLCIRERIDIYMPLFRSKNLKNRQLAASFMSK